MYLSVPSSESPMSHLPARQVSTPGLGAHASPPWSWFLQPGHLLQMSAVNGLLPQTEVLHQPVHRSYISLSTGPTSALSTVPIQTGSHYAGRKSRWVQYFHLSYKGNSLLQDKKRCWFQTRVAFSGRLLMLKLGGCVNTGSSGWGRFILVFPHRTAASDPAVPRTKVN